MNNLKRAVLAAAMLGMAVTPSFAHHSGAMFDQTKEVTVKGVIKEFQYTNPHSWLLVDVTNTDGSVTTWGFEAEGPSTLMRNGVKKSTLPVGAEITVTSHPMRDGRPAGTFGSGVLADGTEVNP